MLRSEVMSSRAIVGGAIGVAIPAITFLVNVSFVPFAVVLGATLGVIYWRFGIGPFLPF